MKKFIDEEHHVIIPTRRQAARPPPEFFQSSDEEGESGEDELGDEEDRLKRRSEAKRKIFKTFSAVSAAQQVLGKCPSTLFGLQVLEGTEEEKETLERRLDCQKRLVFMKARNAESAEEREAGGGTVIQQEDLQEWLDDLQLRLHQACAVSTSSSSSSHRAGPLGGASSRSSRSHHHHHKSGGGGKSKQQQQASSSSSAGIMNSAVSSTLALHHFGRKFSKAAGVVLGSSGSGSSSVGPPSSEVLPGSGASAGPPAGRRHSSRSINGQTDLAAAALTDGQYIERLQSALQQASVSSLQERLAERMVNHSIVHPSANEAASKSVRPKTSLVQQPTIAVAPPVRSHPTSKKPSNAHPPAGTTKATSSSKTVKRKGRSKSKSKAKESSSKVPVEPQQPAASSSPPPRSTSSSLSTETSRGFRAHHHEAPGTSKADERKPAPRKPLFAMRNFFDCGQTVEDIYEAAEQLILPSVKQRGDGESGVDGHSGSSNYYDLLPAMHHQPLEDVEVEDFWSAMPDNLL